MGADDAGPSGKPPWARSDVVPKDYSGSTPPTADTATTQQPELPDRQTAGETTNTSSPADTASPPAPATPVSDAASRIGSSSAERTSALKTARDAALSGQSQLPPMSPSSPSSNTTSSIFGLSSPNNHMTHNPYPAQFSRHNNAPPLPTPFHPPSTRLGLLSDLKRLSYVLSLLLGSSAILGLFWSTFILPLLHSSFSARQVLLEQQITRFDRIVSSLRALRAGTILPPARVALLPVAASSVDSKSDDIAALAGKTGTELALSNPKQTGESDIKEHRSGIEEIQSSTSSPPPSPSPNHLISAEKHDETQDDTATIPAPTNPLPLDGLASLSLSLRSLSGALASTSTTRTSLLSTLESYTSQLHREVYLRSDPKTSFSVGLGSLSQNLANVGAKAGAGTGSTGWDDVRKEVRAIKGLLLGRRNFAPLPAGS